MEEDHVEQIKDIMSRMKCPKDFECYKSGFKNLCKAKDTGIGSFAECLEENTHGCRFLLPFGTTNTNLCMCPVRIYIARNMGK